jgi:hypothetical protein
MLLTRRFGLALASVGVIAAAVLLLGNSHAQATSPLTYSHLNAIQKRIISQTLASAIGAPTTANGAPTEEGGGGPDGAGDTPPSGFASAGSSIKPDSYTPGPDGKCSNTLGTNVKMNQNCLNLTDAPLQGRGQANNETSIAIDPLNPNNIIGSDNDYRRGDGTCGVSYSADGGKTWTDSTTPNGFTYGPEGFAREYWQAGGDTSVAWDTRGNAYESCQLFNRGTVASPNPDQSSTFVLFRSTLNNGASWNFPGRYSTTVTFDPAGTSGVLQDKALMTVDDNTTSRFRDRIYVSWTEFAANGTAYIWETHSDNYGESFSPRVLVSADSSLCTNTFDASTDHGRCNENQYSDPFVGPDGALYVTWSNFNNQPTSGNNNHFQMMLAKSTDGGQTFSAPVQVSPYYDLPDCDTYQGTGADPGRACVPEKGSSKISVFRATNYPSGQVNPKNPHQVVVAFGSYINKDSNPSNGCIPNGFSSSDNPTYKGVKDPNGCVNKILVSVSNDGGATFTGTGADPKAETIVPQTAAQAKTDQWFQWSAFTRNGTLAVDYYDRSYGNDETTGSSDFTLSGSSDLSTFGSTRVTSSSMPAPTQFEGPNGGQFYGDYVGMAAWDQAHPIWSDTRNPDLFLCPGSAVGSHPPALCTGTEPNGQQANDQEIYTDSLNVPTGSGG